MLRPCPPKPLRTLLLAAALLLCGAVHARAAAPPEKVVDGFYRTYMTVTHDDNGERWVQRLVEAQRPNLDKTLADWLTEIANNPPGTDKPWLDFDPFSNSQMGTKKYVVRAAVTNGNKSVVPVALQLNRDPNPPKVRLNVTLEKRNGVWTITNFLYPPEYDVKAWNLKTFLKTELKH